MIGLYVAKYEDIQKVIEHYDSIINRVQPLLNIPEYRDIYTNYMLGLGGALLNVNEIDRAEICFNKLLLDGFDEF